MSAADELANHKLQLDQVEAALLKEPDSEELLKLKTDLEEVIALQEELLVAEGDQGSATTSQVPHINWTVGDRVLAPSSNGQSYPAVIDGISGTTASITFLSNKKELMVETGTLKPLPEKEKGVFESGSGGARGGAKKEWQIEKERRRMKTLKKEQKRKDLETAKEGEKTSWLKFNTKASTKGLKGMKRVVATGSSSDGPSGGLKRDNDVSSRRDQSAFRATQRGNMESLF